MHARRRASRDLSVDERVAVREPVLLEQPTRDLGKEVRPGLDPKRGEPFGQPLEVLRQVEGIASMEADHLVHGVREQEAAVLR